MRRRWGGGWTGPRYMVEMRQVGPCKSGLVTWKKEGDSQSNARRMDRLGIIIFLGGEEVVMVVVVVWWRL